MCAANRVTQSHHLYRTVVARFGPRLLVTSLAWMAGNFAFYGDKLFQSEFIRALYPEVSGSPVCCMLCELRLTDVLSGLRAQATPFQRTQWTALNSAIALTGYWAAAALVDKKWYGRRKMQVRDGDPDPRSGPQMARDSCTLASDDQPASTSFAELQLTPSYRDETSLPDVDFLKGCCLRGATPQAVGFLMVALLTMACGAGYPLLTTSTTGYHTLQARVPPAPPPRRHASLVACFAPGSTRFRLKSTRSQFAPRLHVCEPASFPAAAAARVAANPRCAPRGRARATPNTLLLDPPFSAHLPLN